jgi:Superinfection immunity protein
MEALGQLLSKLILFIVGLLLYFLPTGIAEYRQPGRSRSFFLINLLLAWIPLIWLVLLIGACIGPNKRRGE